MIGFDIVCDKISEAISVSDPVFHWGEDRIIRCSLELLPAPEEIKDFAAGSYFALIDVTEMVPDEEPQGYTDDTYGFTVILCRKGKEGTYSKIRNQICDQFRAGWYRYWEAQNRYIASIKRILVQSVDIEKFYGDVMAAEVFGTIQVRSEKIGVIKD